MSFSRVLCIAIALLAVAVGALAQEPDVRETLLTPLPVRDQFLLNNGFFFFEPESAKVLEENRWSIDWHDAESNSFAKSSWISRRLEGQSTRVSAVETLPSAVYDQESSLFLVHGQTHRATLSIHHSLAPHLELGLAIPVSRIGGGWSDQIVEDFHHAFGLGNAERESFSQNREVVYLRSGNTTYIRERSAAAGIGDMFLTAKTELTWLEDKDVALSVDGAVKFPTGNAQTLNGSGSVDGGVQLLGSRDFGHWRIHASLGVLLLGPNSSLGTKLQFLTTNTEGLSYLLNDRTGMTLQLTVSETPFRNMGMPELNRRSYQLTTGIRRRLGSTMTLYAGFVENLLNYANSADVGMICGISKQF
jgi:uncharacterized protein DUF3187